MPERGPGPFLVGVVAFLVLVTASAATGERRSVLVGESSTDPGCPTGEGPAMDPSARGE